MTKSGTEAVRALFDVKARSWSSKYRQGGPLQHRLTAFSSALTKVMPPPARVLDFGCGTGNLSSELASLGYQVTGCDISQAMLSQARLTAGCSAVDWVGLPPSALLPFDANAFDAVVASSVFEYLEDLDSSLQDLARVLKPGGVLLYTVPLSSHPTRRIEAIAVRLARVKLLAGARSLPRIGGYLDYLRLSRNRLSVNGWEARTASHGLSPASEAYCPLGTLMLLACRARGT